ncbi:GLPGLI family protein [Neolewinella agarilytica]|uniref:GLPGLI family protein n=1 Tax=Neolewinella agarilytica TaxID=478744 RepID=UPI0023546D74|nr:GLPGLI family protein [Neolewinella agarilytica]
MKFFVVIGCFLLLCSIPVCGQEVLEVKYVRENGEKFDPGKVLTAIPDKMTGMTDEILGALEKKHYSMLVFTVEHSLYTNISDQKSLSSNVRVDADTTEAVYYSFGAKEIHQNKPRKSGSLRLHSCDFSHSYSLTNVSKTIAGYTCLEAKVEYCGNDYFVYFTPELPFPTGPRAFVGFPGLVLAVNNAEKTWVVKAIEVKAESEFPEDHIGLGRLKELIPVAKELTLEEYCASKKKQ